MHARRVVPNEEGLVGFLRIIAVEEVDDLGRYLFVYGLRPLERQRTLVLARLVGRLAIGRGARDHWTRGHHAERSLRIHGTWRVGEARDRRVLAWWNDGLLGRALVDVGEAYPLHRVEVIQVAPEFLKAVRGRQGVRVVPKVVLAEFAGVVTELTQEHGERRRAGQQVGRAAGQLRRDHASAQRMHAGKEGIAPGGTTLLGVVVHEDRTLLADAVDVGGFSHHQAAVVDARLHPADVVAHDEEDVGFLLLLRACHRHGGERCEEAEAERPGHTHGLFPQFWL